MATSATGSQIGGVFVRVGADTTGLNRGLREATARINDFDRQAQMATRSIASLGARFAAAFSAVKIIDIADNWGQVASRIKQATNSQEEYNLVQGRLIQSANNTYRSLQESQELFIQTSQAIRSLGYSLEQSIDLTDSFSALLVTNAASADRGRAAINAYSKAIQTGRVDSQTWQTILSAIPSVVDAIAESSGKSATEIRKLGIEGKLALADLNQALLGSLDENMRKVEEMPTTVRDALQRISNNFQNYIGIQNEATGATGALVAALDILADHVEAIAKVAGGVAVAALATYIGRLSASTVATVASYQAKRVATAEELKLAQAQLAQARATMAQITATNAADVSTRKLTAAKIGLEAAEKRLTAAQAAQVTVGRSLLGIMGGPVGLVVSLGLAAGAMYAVSGSAKSASVDVDSLTDSMDSLNRAQLELRRQQAEEALEQARVAAAQAAAEVRALEKDYDYLTSKLGLGVDQAGLDNVNKTLVEARAKLADAEQAADRTAEAFHRLDDAFRASAAGATAVTTAVAFSEAFTKQEAAIKRQIALMGKSGQAAALRYDLEHGELAKLDEEEKRLLRTQIDALDVAEKRLEASRKRGDGERAAKRLAREQKQERERLEKSLEDLERYTATAQEIEVREAAERQSRLAEIFQAGLVDQAKYYGLQEQLAGKHSENMAAVADADLQAELARNQQRYEDGLIGFQDFYAAQQEAVIAHQQALTEIELTAYQDRLALLAEAYEDQQMTEEERRQRELELAEDHASKLAEIERRGAAARSKVSREEARERESQSSKMWNNLTSLMNSGNKELFQIGKVAAIAQATLAGYEAVQDSYKWGAKLGGPALGAVFAATAAAATAAQIASIKNTQFGGGGGVKGGSYSKPTDAIASGPAQAAPQQEQGPAVTINIGDGLYSGKAVRDLIGAINEAVGDGARLRVA